MGVVCLYFLLVVGDTAWDAGGCECELRPAVESSHSTLSLGAGCHPYRSQDIRPQPTRRWYWGRDRTVQTGEGHLTRSCVCETASRGPCCSFRSLHEPLCLVHFTRLGIVTPTQLTSLGLDVRARGEKSSELGVGASDIGLSSGWHLNLAALTSLCVAVLVACCGLLLGCPRLLPAPCPLPAPS